MESEHHHHQTFFVCSTISITNILEPFHWIKNDFEEND